jgi:hypothetical protein
VELVDGVIRLSAMNLFLHGIGPDDEPASALLARLRADRGEAVAGGVVAKRPRRRQGAAS